MAKQLIKSFIHHAKFSGHTMMLEYNDLRLKYVSMLSKNRLILDMKIQSISSFSLLKMKMPNKVKFFLPHLGSVE